MKLAPFFTYLIVCSLFVNHLAISAQTKKQKLENPFTTEGSLNSRFEYLEKTSTTYQEYKVIKKESFSTLKENVNDSISKLTSKIQSLENQITLNNSNNTNLVSSLENYKIDLEEALKEKDSISIFGLSLYKKNYNLIALLTLVLLLTLCGYFLYKFQDSNILTKQAQKALEESQNELETQQKKALATQQQLSRKLQDEIIKNRKE